QFYNTARCWPTRAALLTGYYPQQVRMDPPRGRLPKGTRVLPHYLGPLGYRCYHSGKWHLHGAPRAVADGGFDHSYVLHDHNRFFAPQHHEEDDRPLPPVKPDAGYYATTAIADHAIRCLKEHAAKYADRPFFHYLAFTSPHFPLHALPEDIARYRDRYREGWDVIREQRWRRLRQMGIVNGELSPRRPHAEKPAAGALEKLGPGEEARAIAWNDLTDEQRAFQAIKMAIHAAMVDRMDREIGRVLDQVRAMGAFENTVIFFLSDNGASAELLVRGDGHDRTAAPGSGATYLCLGPGWATAANAPFRGSKIGVYEGGIATPLIVHWPKGLPASARGQLRHDVGHVIDFVPTLLELAGGRAGEPWNGVKPPPLPGRSLVPAFAKDGAVSRDFLFFSHSGNRAIRMGNWKLVASGAEKDSWQLYDLATDRAETVNLAARYPERVRQMEARWKELNAEFQRQAEAP
ncbi:MAG TPA: sulfatase-like hydrolase/transferase, partial [Gemmataceae bacterium]|nr:sulfatase-like hydrolase/transferase [Gemmataceae bacterium]